MPCESFNYYYRWYLFKAYHEPIIKLSILSTVSLSFILIALSCKFCSQKWENWCLQQVMQLADAIWITSTKQEFELKWNNNPCHLHYKVPHIPKPRYVFWLRDKVNCERLRGWVRGRPDFCICHGWDNSDMTDFKTCTLKSS